MGGKSLGHSQSPRMGTKDPLFEINLDLPVKGSRDSARSLYRQLKAAILDGRLAAGAKLPPTRRFEVFSTCRETQRLRYMKGF